MKTYSRTEVRHGQRELLQLKAYASLRFLRGRLLDGPETDVDDLADSVGRILRWERVLLATTRLLGDSSSLVLEAAESPASLAAA
jgi:hypothetical protein